MSFYFLFFSCCIVVYAVKETKWALTFARFYTQIERKKKKTEGNTLEAVEPAIKAFPILILDHWTFQKHVGLFGVLLSLFMPV